MPNWCENRLTVSGERKDVLAFVEANTSEEEALSLARFLPRPEGIHEREDIPTLASFLDQSIPDDKLDWYHWSLRNWGTKWDLNEVQSNISPGQASYQFLSAWSPPLAWLKYVAEAFPLLTFEIIYAETGNYFAGRCLYEHGSLKINDEGDYEESIHEDIWA